MVKANTILNKQIPGSVEKNALKTLSWVLFISASLFNGLKRMMMATLSVW